MSMVDHKLKIKSLQQAKNEPEGRLGDIVTVTDARKLCTIELSPSDFPPRVPGQVAGIRMKPTKGKFMTRQRTTLRMKLKPSSHLRPIGHQPAVRMLCL
jgi:hypothetical protein